MDAGGDDTWTKDGAVEARYDEVFMALHQVTGDPQWQHWGWHMLVVYKHLWQIEVWQLQ